MRATALLIVDRWPYFHKLFNLMCRVALFIAAYCLGLTLIHAHKCAIAHLKRCLGHQSPAEGCRPAASVATLQRLLRIRKWYPFALFVLSACGFAHYLGIA